MAPRPPGVVGPVSGNIFMSFLSHVYQKQPPNIFISCSETLIKKNSYSDITLEILYYLLLYSLFITLFRKYFILLACTCFYLLVLLLKNIYSFEK